MEFATAGKFIGKGFRWIARGGRESAAARRAATAAEATSTASAEATALRRASQAVQAGEG